MPERALQTIASTGRVKWKPRQDGKNEFMNQILCVVCFASTLVRMTDQVKLCI